MRTFHTRQAGATLMEVLVAMSISLVVTASMVAMMSNSLGTTSRIVKMTKLADDMRVTMQMMTRDVRRASYNVDSIKCYANENCLEDGSLVAVVDIEPVDMDSDGEDDCFWFLTDRGGNNYQNDLASNAVAGAFRRRPIDPENDNSSVGVIEMWTGTGLPPDEICVAPDPSVQQDSSWVQITNPSNMDIFRFSVSDDFVDGDAVNGEPLSYTQVIRTDSAGTPLLSQRIRKIHMRLEGRLVMDPTIVRRLEDVISVRNDLLVDNT